jgi:trehalose 6-phosphate synthase
MDSGQESAQQSHLRELSGSVLSKRPLVIASNRGPIEHHATPDGRLEPRRGSGGVVTALSSLTHLLEFTWVASAMGEGDRRLAEERQGERVKSTLPGQRTYVRYVSTPRRIYHKYYNIFCNPLLWFLQHYMWNSPYNPNLDASIHDAWSDGYVPVNQAFAQAVVEEAQRDSRPPLVMTHDYHLYLAPGLIKAKMPEAVVQHFTHIPWPSERYWKLLPEYMRLEIWESLLSADILGFQSRQDVRNFLNCSEEFLDDAQVDHNSQKVLYKGRQCRVRAYPISVNVDEILSIANSPRAMEHERRLRSQLIENVIVRVDRAEPSKNIVRGFRAYGLLLQRYPELQGKVTFLAFLVPSRTHIRQYQRYMEEVQRIMDEINTNFGTSEWRPIRPFLENNYTQALAGMKLYDVLLVNSVIDGMNLVAKEGPLVNSKNGVLVLSDTTGAHHQLRLGALTVSPADVEGTMLALYKALIMGQEERKSRSKALVDAIRREDIGHWLCWQIEDLAELI